MPVLRGAVPVDRRVGSVVGVGRGQGLCPTLAKPEHQGIGIEPGDELLSLSYRDLTDLGVLEVAPELLELRQHPAPSRRASWGDLADAGKRNPREDHRDPDKAERARCREDHGEDGPRSKQDPAGSRPPTAYGVRSLVEPALAHHVVIHQRLHPGQAVTQHTLELAHPYLVTGGEDRLEDLPLVSEQLVAGIVASPEQPVVVPELA